MQVKVAAVQVSLKEHRIPALWNIQKSDIDSEAMRENKVWGGNGKRSNKKVPHGTEAVDIVVHAAPWPRCHWTVDGHNS